jgi:ABC-type glycerol-3-phosphate transport system substrate-binding protein
MNVRPRHGRMIALAAGTVALLAVLVVAAASAANRHSSAVSGTVTIWCTQAQFDSLKVVDPGFAKAYPNITLKYVPFQPADLYQKLQLAAAAGSGFPDAVCLEDSHMAQFVKLGVLADMTSLVKPYVPKILDYQWQQGEANGKFYEMAWDAGPLALFYRRSVFKKAHVDPNSIKTWDDFYRAGLKIKKQGVAMWIQSKAQNDARFYESLLWQQGSGYVNAKGAVTIDKDPRALAALNLMGKMWKAGIISDQQEWTDPWYKTINDGKVATLPMAVWMGTFLKSWLAPKTAGDWGVIPLPAFTPNGSHYANDGGSAISIIKGSSNADAAWAYIQYHLGRADTQSNMYKQTDIFPALESAWRSPYIGQADPYYGNEKVRQLFVAAAQHIPRAYVYSSDYQQMDALMSTEIQKYALGKETAKAALSNAAKEIRSRTGRH